MAEYVASSIARIQARCGTDAGGCRRNIKSYASSSMVEAREVHPRTIAIASVPASTATYAMVCLPGVCLPGRGFFNLVRFLGKRRAQDLRAIGRHQQHVLNTNAQFLFAQIDAGLNGDHHAGLKRG